MPYKRKLNKRFAFKKRTYRILKRAANKWNKKNSRFKGGKLVKSNRNVKIQSMNKQVFPRSMTIEVNSELQIYYPTPFPQNNYFDIKLNSCVFPWQPTATGTRHVSAAGFTLVTNTAPIATTLPLGVNALLKQGNNGIYRCYQVHAAQLKIDQVIGTSGDTNYMCIACTNPAVAAPPTTYEALIQRPFSKGTMIRAFDNSGYNLSYYINLKQLLGMSKVQYDVLGKESGADALFREVQGNYSGSFIADPKINYVFRVAYQTGDNAVSSGTTGLQMRLRVKYWVEFFHFSNEVSTA